MRAAILLPLVAAAAQARDSIHNHAEHGICRSQLLEGQVGLANPVCGSENLLARIQEHLVHPERQGWTHDTPCVKNGTTEFCVFTNTNFAVGRGVSVLTTKKAAAHIALTPAFKTPGLLAHANQAVNPNFDIVPVPGKDMGAVATKHFNRGDFIMSNTASALIDYAAFEALNIDKVKELQAIGISQLPEPHRSQFLNLSTHYPTNNYHDKVERIFVTNAFDIDFDDEDETNFYAMFPDISRMNHDCRPNADYHFNPRTMTQYVYALRPIARGEEITISYIDPFRSQAKRLEKLEKTWGFKCGCSACAQHSHIAAASDARLEQIEELRKELHDYTSKSRATPQMAELMISLYEQERIAALQYEAYTLAAVEWNGVGEPWLATKYANLAVEYGLPSAGQEDKDVKEMIKLAADPWSHWSWMLRTSRRMNWGPKDEKRREVDDDDDDDDDDDE